MNIIPPKDFTIDDFYEGIYTFQKYEVFPGHVTQGPKDVLKHLKALHVPERLDGLRVLDIAPWNGFFSFECARRGAAEVISFGPDDPDQTGYNKTKKVLEADTCHYIRGSVYDLSPEKHGQFDLVLCLGLIYHLRYPLLALDRIFDISTDRLFIDSPIIDRVIFDKTLTEKEKRAVTKSQAIHKLLPLVYFTKSKETGDDYNWFIPNKRAFQDFVMSSGFEVNSYGDDGGWASISASKTSRTFTPNLEGWNEGAAKKR